LAYDAMAYSVVKEIGSLYFAAKGQIDGILITGGIAYSDYFIKYLKDHINPIYPIKVYPGEDEMRSLAEGALRVMLKEEKSQVY